MRRISSVCMSAWQRGIVLLLPLLCHPALAAELEDAKTLLLTGDYTKCIRVCNDAGSNPYPAEDWALLKAQAHLAVGNYSQAEAAISNGIWRSETSIRLRLLGLETARFNNRTNLVSTRLQEINQMASARLMAYQDPPNIVALGRTALILGADPKTVLERLFDPAMKTDPKSRDAWLAKGELALEKHDFALASRIFTEALKQFPDDAEMTCGLARAFQPSDRGKMLELVEAALEANPQHIPSMLLRAEHLVDAEEYDAAEKQLADALKVNPWHPAAWAFRAVVAHLQNDPKKEADARIAALKHWSTNPQVDHLIGLKLSQKYRFTEGAECQRRALRFDPSYLPARMQLAEDLLRLGEETEGWRLAEQVHELDGYDVTAYNLVTLHGTMQKFATLTNTDFILRMSEKEAELYGDRALELLQRAKDSLTAKYGIELEQPTVVEIFPEQKDFGVRTFGMPHNPGFLGVCFGRVVTANSPASQGGNPNNWEAVLWHEFCHVVTLQMTKNKMPRWLSEGISVYEELQQNTSWGQRMTPRYREMVLGEDLTPVSELSSAFLTPKSDLHLQFAYYQSALVVEYVVTKYGFDQLKAILRDLADGSDINEVITRHTAPIKQLEKEFEAFAKARAEALGPGLDWEKPEPSFLERLGLFSNRNDRELPVPTVERSEVSTNSTTADEAHGEPPATAPKDERKRKDAPNYWQLVADAREFIANEDWKGAKTPLNTLVELCPDQSERDNAYAMLAEVHHELGETNLEKAALEKWASQSSDALDAYLRLIEISVAEADWKSVLLNSERCIAVNPLIPQPYRSLGRAAEALGEPKQAITGYQKLLLLDPADPADVHFRLARMLHTDGDTAARRQVLQALEEAPRFREAHRLLLELAAADHSQTNALQLR